MLNSISQLSILCRGDILTMTTLAASGHPGGSMSMVDMLLTVYKHANISPDNVNSLDRDRIIVSNGHTSPAVYSVLGRLGFFSIDEAIVGFRKSGSRFEGHIERIVPGVEWSTGNLGQGLSAAAGFAVAGRLLRKNYNIYVFMGDGENQKGQLSEARRFIKKYNFNNITAFIDYNRLQISGNISNIMPQDIKAEYMSAGWHVLEIDGHNFNEIDKSLSEAVNIDSPVLILANTIMGKGVSFMENKEVYHGKPLSEEEYFKAIDELGISIDYEKYKREREQKQYKNEEEIDNKINNPINSQVYLGSPILYSKDQKIDNRSAFGNALYDVIKANYNKNTPVAVFDCDLASSVKTDKVLKEFPDIFFESGIQEHHTATASGAASINGIISVFADFGVFGIDEVYNQMRLNDINNTNLKLVTTHVGVDVGEDGKTHQCIDYIGILRNLYNFKIIVPADGNQTDKAFRYMIKNNGNYLLAMGRSKLPIITKENGSVFFDNSYQYEYGKIDVIRDGQYPLFTYGTMLYRAIKVAEILKENGVSVAILNVSAPLQLDEKILGQYLSNNIAFTYEDHNINTGLFPILSQYITINNKHTKLVPFGIKNYTLSGKPDEVFKLIGLDEYSVAERILRSLKSFLKNLI
jgi:transketolase